VLPTFFLDVAVRPEPTTPPPSPRRTAEHPGALDGIHHPARDRRRRDDHDRRVERHDGTSPVLP
jgi:hypothetical protein